MTSSGEQAPFWTALAAWGVATTAFTVAYTEATITPLADDPTLAAITRFTAYVMAAFTVVGMLGLTTAMALVMSATLRWIDVETDFRAVLATLWPGVAILAGFSLGAAVLIWLSPAPAPLPGPPEEWGRLRQSIANQFPLRQISLVRPWVRGSAAAAVLVTMQRRLDCDWLEAGIGVGVAVACYLLVSVAARSVL